MMKKLKAEVEKNGKEGKSKMIASCGFLEDEMRQCSKEGRSEETLGVDMNGLGVKEKAMRKKCRLRFSLIEKKNKVLQKNCMKVVVKKLLRAGMVPARTW